MTAAAPSPGLTNPTTAALRLLGAVRWLALFLLLHWLIAVGRKLAAVIRLGTANPNFPLIAKRFGTDDPAAILVRVTGGLRRATALEDELLATGPTDRRLTDLTHCRAIGAQIVEIGRTLGVFLDAHATTRAIRRGNRAASHRNHVQRRWFPLALAQPVATAPATCVQPVATGPPASQHHDRIVKTDAGVPWNFSRRTPASAVRTFLTRAQRAKNLLCDPCVLRSPCV